MLKKNNTELLNIRIVIEYLHVKIIVIKKKLLKQIIKQKFLINKKYKN